MNKYYLITQISLRCKIRLLVWDYILSVRLYSINTTDFKPSKSPLDPTLLRNRDRAMGVSVVESSQGRIIQCAQCARAHHEGPPHWRPHRQAVVKFVMLKFVTEVWLERIEIRTTKKVISFYGEKKLRRSHQKQCTLCRDRLIGP